MEAHPRSAARFPLEGACLRPGKAGSAASRWGCILSCVVGNAWRFGALI